MTNLFKIDASAGSGKTYSLTRRFLELLADGDMHVEAHCNALPRMGADGNATGSAVSKSLDVASIESAFDKAENPHAFSKKSFRYNFSEILALTFTNLAASQMQERVISSLKNLALGTDAVNSEDKQWTKEDAAQALEQIFRRYSALNIRTIDSLLHHLVRISALELDISPQFEVTFDSAQVISPLFDEIALSALHDETLAKIFDEICQSIIDNTPKFSKFLAGDILKKQCISIAYSLANSGHSSVCVGDANENTLPDGKGLPDEKAVVEAVATSENLDDARCILEKMGLTLEGFEEYAQGEKSWDDFLGVGFVENQEAVFTGEDELNVVLEEIIAEAVGAAKELHTLMEKESLAVNANFLKALSALIGGVNKNSTYFSKDGLDACLNAASKEKASDEAYRRYIMFKECVNNHTVLVPILRKALKFLPMLELAKLVEARVWAQEKEKSLLLSSRMPSLVSKILRDEYYVSGAFCRMGSHLTHILFDEFQDTSNEQWKALEPLAREALSLAGSVFFVGDVKQAIYGWRGGDAELFDRAPQGLERYASEHEYKPLEYNWRSEACIVEWNNAFFQGLSHVENVRNALSLFEKKFEEKIKTEYELQDICHACAEKVGKIYTHVKQGISPKKKDEKPTGLVQVHHINVPKKKVQIATLSLIASSVQTLGERHEWQDICVLTVTNAQAALVSELLLSQSIPVVSQGSLLMAEHPIIIELTALMRFLSNPMDEQAFWHVLISKHILPTSFYEAPLFDFLASKRKESLFQSFKKQFSELWDIYFKPLLDGAGLMTAYDTLCEVYSRWELRARKPDADIFLLRFLEIVHLAEENSLMDLDAFLSWWDVHAMAEKAPLPQNTGAVSVMTVHKAKGLEFAAVLIPWHDFKVEPDMETPQLIEYKYKNKKLKLFTNLMKAHGSPYYKALFEKAVESINTLYVAWTRAVKELHIFLPEETDKEFPQFVNYMLEALKKENAGALCSASLDEFEDYMSYGSLADAQAAPLVDPAFLRMLEYWLCQNNEEFIGVYNSAKKHVLNQSKNMPYFEYIDDDDFENLQSGDVLYMAKKISFLFSDMLKKKLDGKKKNQSDIPDKSNKAVQTNVLRRGDLLSVCNESWEDMPTGTLLAPKDLQELHAKEWERPMAWLPRLKVFRSNLEDIRKHGEISANKRGTLMHKCLECLVSSGDIPSDVQRAVKEAIGFSPSNTKLYKGVGEIHGAEEFNDALTWFLELEAPFGGAQEWLRYGSKEHALSSADGKMYRVDLLVNIPQGIKESLQKEYLDIEWIAIDYKTGYHGDLPSEDNVEQIKNYLSLLDEAIQKKSIQQKDNSRTQHEEKEAPKRVLGMLIYLDRKEICLINFQGEL